MSGNQIANDDIFVEALDEDISDDDSVECEKSRLILRH